jgi:hypothetical protein
MNSTELRLVVSVTTQGRFKEGQIQLDGKGLPYRYDRCFLGNPNDTARQLFMEVANGSTQFFLENYSFHMGSEGQISYIKYIDLETKEEKVTRKIRETNGKFFSVVFTKKDGTLRKMTARIKTSKGVNGKGMKYIPSDKKLAVVYAMDKLEFRMVSLDTVVSFKCQGVVTNF